MEKYFKAFLVLMTIVGVTLLVRSFIRASSSETSIENAESPASWENPYFKLAKLPLGTIAQVDGVTVLTSDLANDAVLRGINQELNELGIVEFYKQKVMGKDGQGALQFFMEQPEQPLNEIFNRFGILLNPAVVISFLPPKPKTFAQWGGVEYGKRDFERSNYRWGGLETRVFVRTLKLVAKKVENSFLTQAAKAQGQSTQDYIEKTILKNLKFISPEARQDAIETFLYESIIPLPILIDTEVPNFPIEIKTDWTPSVGPADASRKVIVFSDFYSEGARDWIARLQELALQYPQVYFGFRPIFPPQDRFQRMLAELSFCVWAQAPESFWPFLSAAISVPEKTFESSLYTVVEKTGIPLQPIKTCFYEQEHRKVVEYHLDYAKYLNIAAGPVMFVDGFVFVGDLSKENLSLVFGR